MFTGITAAHGVRPAPDAPGRGRPARDRHLPGSGRRPDRGQHRRQRRLSHRHRPGRRGLHRGCVGGDPLPDDAHGRQGGRPGQPGEGPARRRSASGGTSFSATSTAWERSGRRRSAPDRSSSASRSIRDSAGTSSTRDRSPWTASASPSTAVKKTCFMLISSRIPPPGRPSGSKTVSERVNIETDILARYVEKLISGGKGNGRPARRLPPGGSIWTCLPDTGF